MTKEANNNSKKEYDPEIEEVLRDGMKEILNKMLQGPYKNMIEQVVEEIFITPKNEEIN
ncbi:MAG: hypothetical protein HQL69_19310 [Magnetococcales bacterium]|nr:hypothetical protein [Magnetococcales bacterium]